MTRKGSLHSPRRVYVCLVGRNERIIPQHILEGILPFSFKGEVRKRKIDDRLVDLLDQLLQSCAESE